MLAVREFQRHGGLAKVTSRYMMVVFSLFAVAMVARIATTLIFPSRGTVLSGGFMEQMTFYNGIVQGILIALGYMAEAERFRFGVDPARVREALRELEDAVASRPPGCT